MKQQTNQIQDFYSPWICKQNHIWESVLHLGQKHLYNKGSLILGNGHPVDHLYYLRVGQVKFFRISSEGDEKTVWYIDKQNLFGVAPFFDQRPTTNMGNFLVAIDDCEIYTFSRECFNDKIRVLYPDLVANLFQSMAYKIFLAVNRGGDLESLPIRFCKVLHYVIQREKSSQISGNVVHSKGISQQELAFILGVHRVTLNNVISQLKQEGIIGHFSKRNLVINDMARLLAYAQARIDA